MTGGLIGVVFVLNALILAYAIHVSRPSSSLPGPPAAAAPAAGVRLARTAPVIPGLHNDHPLAAHERGDVLIAELNCTACHATPQPRLEARQAPDLSTVGGRVDPAFLRAFIADPAAVDPGTTMPDMLGERTADERLAIAADIAAFLVDQSTMPFERTVVDPEPATRRAMPMEANSTRPVSCRSPTSARSTAWRRSPTSCSSRSRCVLPGGCPT
jgi:cytochrome c2